MSACVRGCTHWRRHSRECPVEDRAAGAWVPWEATEHTFSTDLAAVEAVCDADHRHSLAQRVHITKRGTLEVWAVCNGCAPRKALHGCLCEQCHLRLAGWLGKGPGALAWAYGWIAGDLQPSQSTAQSGKITRGKPAPPAAMALHVHTLRQNITHYLGSWLAIVTGEFGLVGPDWWSWRDVDHMYPNNQHEVDNAAQYLETWLDRAEAVSGLVEQMWEEAEHLMRRVSAQAPWEPRRQRLNGLSCPECEREALCLVEGDEHLTCRRCGALVHRAKYDRWAFMIASEKEKVG